MQAPLAASEIKSAIEQLKSRLGAVEAAHAEPTDVPSTKQLIKVRMAAKQVDKAAGELNKVLRIKLKETNNV